MSPNGQFMLNEMDFEQQIRNMKDRELLEFVARQTYGVYILAGENRNRIKGLESQRHKAFGLTGGAGAFFGAAVAVLADWFIRE